MREYTIADQEVLITDEMENELNLRKSLDYTIENIPSAFENWWGGLWGGCEDLIKKSNALATATFTPVIQRASEILQEHRVYNIDTELFVAKYAGTYFDEAIQILDSVNMELQRIDEKYQQEAEFRKLQKLYRTRVVGTGFGIGGTLKSMAVAGAINTATGMAHGIGNAVGNAGSGVAAGTSKDEIFRSVKQPLLEAVMGGAFILREGLRRALKVEAGIECRPVYLNESKEAQVILKNCQNNIIPEEDQRSMLAEALCLNPYDDNIYYAIWLKYGDANFDLRNMAEFYGRDLQYRIQKDANDYGESFLRQCCAPCISAFNKKAMAVCYQKELESAKNAFEEYQERLYLKEDAIPQLALCKELLEIADIEMRTVNEIFFSTPELADSYRHDHMLLLNAFEENKENLEDIESIINNLPFETEEYKSNLSNYIEEEKKIRDANFIFSNIKEFIHKHYSGGEKDKLYFYVPGQIGNFAQVEQMVKKSSKLEENEIPLFLCTLTLNGSNGILFTNKAIREYSGAFLFGHSHVFPLNNMESIECIEEGTYTLYYDSGKIETISFGKGKLDGATQIELGEIFAKVQKIIQQLSIKEKEKLYRACNGTAVCTCGTHLLKGEIFCPNCKKIKKDSGDFVTSKECPHCHDLIPESSKYCRYCGEKL